MKSSFLVKASLTILSAVCLAPQLHASPILSENFDELTAALSVTSVGAFHTLNGTNVDIVGGSLFGSLCAGPESGNCRPRRLRR